jgi:quinol monooxygenase YgiN
MTAIRVIVSITAPSVEAAEETLRQRIEACKRTEAEEEGCLQFEVFRSAMRPERLVVMELWASKAVYDLHWRAVQERDRLNPPAPPVPGVARPVVEMYRQTVFARVDGIWQAADASERMETIRWT